MGRQRSARVFARSACIIASRGRSWRRSTSKQPRRPEPSSAAGARAGRARSHHRPPERLAWAGTRK
eukprot:1598270-Alexandrium_andersonii.AAC.1